MVISPFLCKSFHPSHSISSLPSSQSFLPSQCQDLGIHMVLELQVHWNSPHFKGATGQSWKEKSSRYPGHTVSLDQPSGLLITSIYTTVTCTTSFSTELTHCTGNPSTTTFSSVPSLQSLSPSQTHSGMRHSLLRGQKCLVAQTDCLVQLFSSEWSQQSGCPSHLMMSATHWPLAHLNSLMLHSCVSSWGRKDKRVCQFQDGYGRSLDKACYCCKQFKQQK